jgi:hypothetical protein
MTDRFTIKCAMLYKKARTLKSPNIMYLMYEEDPTTWYILLHSIEGLPNGEYLVKMILPRGNTLPESFPFVPPRFEFLTPQGVYGTETTVCVHVGQYHSDNYLISGGIPCFCSYLVSGLMYPEEIGGGISILKAPLNKRIKYAAESHEYNMARYGKLYTDILEANADISGC